MQHIRYGILLAASAPLILGSCSSDYPDGKPDVACSGREICFAPREIPSSRSACATTSDTDMPVLTSAADSTAPQLHCTSDIQPMSSAASRATATTSPSQISKIGVIAHASWYGPLLMANDLYERDASGVYKSENVRYWTDEPGATVDFYAITPYNAEGLMLPADKSSTTLSLSIPIYADAQQDLILAVNKGIAGDFNQSVPLSFRHLLAGVKVRFGELPRGWRAKSVSLAGVHRSGTLDFASDAPVWSFTDEATSTLIAGVSGTANPEALFMLLPQAATESSPVTLIVTVNDGTKDITYTGMLSSSAWSMGNISTYTVSIYNYKFSIDSTDEVDAHYVIHRTDLKAENVPAGRRWTVTCSASADVTIQLQSDMNTFAQQGFWTDRLYIGSSGTPSSSARGEASLTLSGSGSFPVAVFIPENAGDVARDVTLTVQVEGKSTAEEPLTIRQLCPAWTDSSFGWEQIDDDTSDEYGFKWERVVYYGYVYSATLVGGNVYRNYCQSIIDDNNAGAYASTEWYSAGIGRRRCAIRIDYGKLNNLSGIAGSRNNGRQNTVNLNNRAGSATTGAFEEVVKNILKTESGHTTEPAFRLGNGSSGEAPAPSGDNINGSPGVGECLKKNRYNLRQTTSGSGDVATVPFITDADIVWYMPAVDQFSQLPGQVVSPVVPADCWSSTAVTDGTNAYLGNGTATDRLTPHKVRAARNR